MKKYGAEIVALTGLILGSAWILLLYVDGHGIANIFN